MTKMTPTIPTLDFDVSPVAYGEHTDEIEIQRTVTPALLKRAAKQKTVAMMKREHLREIMPEAPEPGYTYHIVSNGDFDFWTWTPVMLDWIGYADEFFCSTWTLSRGNCVELLALIDAGRIKEIRVDWYRSHNIIVRRDQVSFQDSFPQNPSFLLDNFRSH